MNNAPTTYKSKIVCRNCLLTDEIDIPIKILVFDHLHQKECKFCGNKGTLAQLRPEGI